MRITKKKAAVVVVISAVAMAGAGGAYAYWTTGGTGTGTAKAGSTENFDVTQDAPITNLLLDLGQTVNFKVTNPATFAQYLTAVNLTVAPFSAQADINKPACTATDFAITNVSIAAGDIAAGAFRAGTATVTLTNKATNQDNCKLAPISLSYVAS